MTKIETCNNLWVCWCPDTGKREIRFPSAESLQAHVDLVKSMPLRRTYAWVGSTLNERGKSIVDLLVVNTGCSKATAEAFNECYTRYEIPMRERYVGGVKKQGPGFRWGQAT